MRMSQNSPSLLWELLLLRGVIGLVEWGICTMLYIPLPTEASTEAHAPCSPAWGTVPFWGASERRESRFKS